MEEGLIIWLKIYLVGFFSNWLIQSLIAVKYVIVTKKRVAWFTFLIDGFLIRPIVNPKWMAINILSWVLTISTLDILLFADLSERD